ncbi:hypothetical protein ACI514_01210 [Pseudomonas sp. M20]
MTDSRKGSALPGYRIALVDNRVGVLEEGRLQDVLQALAGFTSAEEA